MNYWEECIRIAFSDAHIVASEDQIKEVIGCVAGAHDNYSMYHGHDVANKNFISDDKRALETLKKEISDKEEWISSTKPCRACITTGTVRDAWGRYTVCYACDGSGRVK